VLCIDDFHYIKGENTQFVLKSLKKACDNSHHKSKLIVVSKKNVASNEDVDFLDTLRIELQGLETKDAVTLVKSFLDLHQYQGMDAKDVEKFVSCVEGNPYLLKMACVLLVFKKYPLTQFLNQNFLTQEDFIAFIYSHYLNFYDRLY